MSDPMEDIERPSEGMSDTDIKALQRRNIRKLLHTPRVVKVKIGLDKLTAAEQLSIAYWLIQDLRERGEDI